MQTKECYREYIKSQITKPRIWHISIKNLRNYEDSNISNSIYSKDSCSLKSKSCSSNFSHSIAYPRDRLIERKIHHIIESYTKPSYVKYNNNGKLSFVRTNHNVLHILMYCAITSEVRLYNLINSLRKNKKYYVLVPKIMKNDFKIVKFNLPLIVGRFGIKEPNSRLSYKIDMIDIAIVPVLGVDKNFKRVGFGKGMYDRFYAKLRFRPYTVFVSRKQFISNVALCCDYDIHADVYVSGK
ncbi:5-formyltetrahydrofolate cyclo-ligase [Helicobacter muridarum]|uniref:5-formyltetrahydrofolate cyclo-ligase n=1 Tax=Helicobacter muridarum TaxID=216 RepID=A0A377PTB5_9HELI|nr:5-formyltetrahydrofolate cyclo-ligase [Helicobacter muridarum]TLD99558.1 5-formyltetrahydrofolate cyclo-ligase [Helicobacter muridarum]STQ85895.1 5-formyltetrahydrofolate cyclo-ligase [Helicobacter muridarum]